jgi:hypothetical protein
MDAVISFEIRSLQKLNRKNFGLAHCTIRELIEQTNEEMQVFWIKLDPEGKANSSIHLNEAGKEYDPLALSMLIYTGSEADANAIYKAKKKEHVSPRKSSIVLGKQEDWREEEVAWEMANETEKME